MVIFFKFMDKKSHYEFDVKKEIYVLTEKATEEDKKSYKEYLKIMKK